MNFAGMNYIAVLAAAIAGFAVGMGWYMTLGNAWMAALGKTKDELKPSPKPFIISGLALIVMAYVLAGLIGHMGEISIRNGVISGGFIWLGFIITTMSVNHAYQESPVRLTLIDGGHWLAVLIVMGAVIGAFGA